MGKNLPVELTTLCWIENQKGEVLLQERTKKDWPGYTFPGGHVLAGESLIAGVIREVLEETGLVIAPEFLGLAEWLAPDGIKREMAALFKTTVTKNFTCATEGNLTWQAKEQLKTIPLAGTLGELLPIFTGEARYYHRD